MVQLLTVRWEGERSMKKHLFVAIVCSVSMVFLVGMGSAFAQMEGRGQGPEFCPFCGQGCGGSPGFQPGIPEKLPSPVNEGWTERLRTVLAMEKLSRLQYEADSRKYQVTMPYRMILFQEEAHIDWISRLFSAYGLSSEVETPAPRESKTLTEAYEIAMDLEEELMPHYDWLVRNAQDPDSRDLLDYILLQTRMHYTMFSHAVQMGWRMGPGMPMHRGN